MEKNVLYRNHIKRFIFHFFLKKMCGYYLTQKNDVSESSFNKCKYNKTNVVYKNVHYYCYSDLTPAESKILQNTFKKMKYQIPTIL